MISLRINRAIAPPKMFSFIYKWYLFQVNRQCTNNYTVLNMEELKVIVIALLILKTFSGSSTFMATSSFPKIWIKYSRSKIFLWWSNSQKASKNRSSTWPQLFLVLVEWFSEESSLFVRYFERAICTLNHKTFRSTTSKTVI